MKNSKILVLDYGEKKIGIALIQMAMQIVTPLAVIANKTQKNNWQQLDDLVAKWQPKQLLLGMPLNMDGTDTRITPKVKIFSNRLLKRYKLPVIATDERLSSYEARLLGKDIRTSDNKIDDIAALVIAKTWLQTLAIEN